MRKTVEETAENELSWKWQKLLTPTGKVVQTSLGIMIECVIIHLTVIRIASI